jgi:Protein of unknown function (DUF4238)
MEWSEPPRPSAAEIKTLALFGAFLRGRGPGFEEEINQQMSDYAKSIARFITSSDAHTEAILGKYEADTGRKVSVTAKSLVDFVKRDDYDVEVNRNESLKQMLRLSPKFAQYFLQMDWMFIEAPKESSFVTSDNPFVTVPFGAGILTPRSRKTIPLTGRIARVMFDQGQRVRMIKASKDAVRSINLAVSRRSRRFVVARDEALLRSVVRKTGLS